MAKHESETYLRFLDGSVVPITHGTDIHALFPLLIPLLEELLHDAVTPSAVEWKRLGWGCKVSTMDHVLEDLQRQKNKRVPFLYLGQTRHEAKIFTGSLIFVIDL